MNLAEKRIKSALSQAADFHRNGESPNEACAKAASLNELNPDMTKRLVEGFNIGKTNATIAKATDKTASFPIANAEEVMKLAFVDSPLIAKSAAPQPLQKTAAASAPAYVEHLVESNLDLVGNQKVAEAPTEFREHFRQVKGVLESNKHELSKIAQDRVYSESKMEASLSSLTDYFLSSNNAGKFASFEGDVLSMYGDAAKPALNIIYESANCKDPRVEGNVKVGSVNVQEDEPHRLFDALIEATNSYVTNCKLQGEKIAQFASEEKELMSLVNQASGIVEPEPVIKTAADAISFPKGGRLKKVSMEIAPTANLVSAATQGYNSALSGQFGKAHEKAQQDKYSIPKDRADAEMSNVRRQAILQNLMVNDEIISMQDPDQIQASYNTLLGMAPDLTLHPEIVRSFLRSSNAHQAVDPFTANQLATTQGQLSKNKVLATGAVPK